ncbi:winged helix-turn-helix transcriptional regulator [Martelella sp. HB161492]|uniref:winged helix-turn-helix transcriptional regulator n=1 Tax=Martelella sp. HB161492 TaxID=2720726 RepID=UPI0015920A2E|nr:winged helix-turn-helix transcriptional regulator [Martelella sp. HB161492]
MSPLPHNVSEDRLERPGMSSTDISDHNVRTVIAALRQTNAMSRRSLASGLGLTETAISAIVRRMEGAGYIRQNAAVKGVRGATYSIADTAAAGIGIWLSPDGGTASLVSLTGRIVREERFASPDRLGQWLDETVRSHGFGTLCGIALACEEPLEDKAGALLASHGGGLATRLLRSTEAVLWHQRLIADQRTERGLGVIIIGDTVRAGTMFSDRFFHGAHGRAGALGGMRPALDAPTLNDVAGRKSYLQHMKNNGSEDEWINRAASRLLDAIIAMAGFVSPAVIAVGGFLPEMVTQRIVERVVADKALQASYFIATKWTPEIQHLCDTDARIARGAAMVPLRDALLPLPEPGMMAV